MIPSRPTPERISQESSSLRGVVMRDWPGRRRSSSNWSSSRVSSSRGGTPSTTQPTPPPWDSPKVVTRNTRPKELPMARTPGSGERRGRDSGQGFRAFAGRGRRVEIHLGRLVAEHVARRRRGRSEEARGERSGATDAEAFARVVDARATRGDGPGAFTHSFRGVGTRPGAARGEVRRRRDGDGEGRRGPRRGRPRRR